MALDGKRQVLRTHAGPVVADTDETLAAAAKGHVDLPRAGVNGILDEFLHHTGGAFDHLARRDAVHRSF